MRILIDNRLSAYRTGGIPQYSQQLISALIDLIGDDRLIVLDHRKQADPIRWHDPRITRRRAWTPPHHRWEQAALPFEIAPLGADVLHFPDFIPLFKLRTPTVITVHDLAFRRYPEILDAAARRYYGQIERAVARADAIIAPSWSTRRDLIELLGVASDRIEVVPEAAAPPFRLLDLPPDDTRSINGLMLSRDQFALFVGTIEPRKNLAVLVEALAVLRDRDLSAAPPLVIAGARGWLDDALYDRIRQQRLADLIHFVGPVDLDALIWLYNACRVYLHPELYSGFGLPILEAMQCGAPVIAADTSSLPEVAGAAGLLVPPDDPAAWADTWQHVWRDDAVRDRLRSAGMEQAARFSWTAAARATLAVYRRLHAK